MWLIASRSQRTLNHNNVPNTWWSSALEGTGNDFVTFECVFSLLFILFDCCLAFFIYCVLNVLCFASYLWCAFALCIWFVLIASCFGALCVHIDAHTESHRVCARAIDRCTIASYALHWAGKSEWVRWSADCSERTHTFDTNPISFSLPLAKYLSRWSVRISVVALPFTDSKPIRWRFRMYEEMNEPHAHWHCSVPNLTHFLNITDFFFLCVVSFYAHKLTECSFPNAIKFEFCCWVFHIFVINRKKKKRGTSVKGI